MVDLQEIFRGQELFVQFLSPRQENCTSLNSPDSRTIFGTSLVRLAERPLQKYLDAALVERAVLISGKTIKTIKFLPQSRLLEVELV